VLVRLDGYIDVVPIGSLIAHPPVGEPGARVSTPGGGIEIWDGEHFVGVLARTAYWYDGDSVLVHGRGGIIQTTPDHLHITPDGEAEAQALTAGDRIVLGDQPQPTLLTTMTEEEAWLLGILAAEGYVAANGRARVTCHDDAVLARAAACWERVSGGVARKHAGVRSAFSERRTPAVDLDGNRPYGRLLRGELYTADGDKRVPRRILNASPHLQVEFLAAYNLGDGLRAGHGVDPFESFRTTSPTLASGLVWLSRTALGRRVSVYPQPGALGGGDSYLINLDSGLTPGQKGSHLRRPLSEVRRVEHRSYRGWMCDLATESGRFAAGVGSVITHNSPRRGLEFVTRKISHGAAQIKLGRASELRLGNLEARRDWGFAGDYVEAMWLMLQQEEPGDFVVATGETHSVRELCELAFRHAGLQFTDHVVQDERYMRPAEVDLLVGDASRAKATLGWKPRVTFAELVAMMVDADLALLSGELDELHRR
jgi:GDPmannose 4,6-dehydratase